MKDEGALALEFGWVAAEFLHGRGETRNAKTLLEETAKLLESLLRCLGLV